MRKSALFAVLRYFIMVFAFLATLSIFTLGTSTSAHAQQTTTLPGETTTATADSYKQPNFAPDVEQNHHTYTQVVVIDVLSAFVCQLVGVDPTQPSKPCLGVNMATGQYSYPPKELTQNGNQPFAVGGAVGMLSNQIAYMFIPPGSASQYGTYLAANFGIVKNAHAQANFQDCTKIGNGIGYGYCGLQIIFHLWTIVRDVAYAILTIAFILLALGVMLRFKVDPRTVMTLQNQIPRVIIAIIMITFSYPIAGVMIDIMWTVTYTGMNLITQESDAKICDHDKDKTLSQAASFNIIDNPASFVNTVFSSDCAGAFDSGVFQISGKVSYALGTLISSVLTELLGIDPDAECGLFDIGACVDGVILWLVTVLVFIIIFVIVLATLLRLWFVLLRTYIPLLMFIILGPFWIVMGLFPGRPLGIEKWMRVIFANLAVFPVVAFVLVFGRQLMDSVPENVSPLRVFIPPLVGNPNVNFGVLLGFGALLLAPTIPDIIKEKMKATGGAKYGAAIAGAIGFGAGIATSPAKGYWKNATRRDHTGAPIGHLAIAGEQALQKLPWTRTMRQRNRLARQAQGDMKKYKELKDKAKKP